MKSTEIRKLEGLFTYTDSHGDLCVIKPKLKGQNGKGLVCMDYFLCDTINGHETSMGDPDLRVLIKAIESRTFLL